MKIIDYFLKNKMFNTTNITVLDIGARAAKVGNWAVFGQGLRYLGFEPDEKECTRLNEEVAQKKVSWEERYFPLALGKNNEKRIFYNTEKPQCSSLLEPNPAPLEGFSVVDYLTIKNTNEVNTNTLDQWANMYFIPSVDFIKIDTQGAELEILQGGRELVDSVLGLEIEVEFLDVYKNQPLFGDIDAWIRSKGFILFDISKIFGKRLTVSQEFQSNGQLVWGDALYFRDVNYIFNKSQNAESYVNILLKLAAIADLYGIPDYSLYVLEKTVERYSKHLGNEIQVINKMKSDVKTLLDKSNLPKNGTTYSVAEYSFMSKFFHFLSILSPKISKKLGIKTETVKPSYFWREKKR